MRCVALALAALVFAPAAGAWTTVPGAVQNIVIPSMLVTQAGTELVSFESPSADTISVARSGGAPRVVAANDPIAGRTQLVQQPNDAIQLYFPNAQGVARMTSVDDGQTWAGPFQTQSHDVGGVEGAAVAPDGTPYFSQDGTGFVNVFRGLDGDTVSNVFPFCCGYGESLAVDSSGLVQVAFYSNKDADGTFLYEPLNGSLAPGAATSLKPTAPHDDRVPLVSDRSGNTFMAWPPGHPAVAFTVVPFRGGSPAGDGVSFQGVFAGGDPHMALSVDANDRLWAVWTGQGKVHAARSRSHGADFGAAVSVALPGTGYQVSALGLTGSVDVIVNIGATLVEQQLLPGLSVRVYKVGKKQWWAQALDDGFGVRGATFAIKGHTFHGNTAGKAKVVAGSGKAAAPGYVGAAFKVP